MPNSDFVTFHCESGVVTVGPLSDDAMVIMGVLRDPVHVSTTQDLDGLAVLTGGEDLDVNIEIIRSEETGALNLLEGWDWSVEQEIFSSEPLYAFDIDREAVHPVTKESGYFTLRVAGRVRTAALPPHLLTWTVFNELRIDCRPSSPDNLQEARTVVGVKDAQAVDSPPVESAQLEEHAVERAADRLGRLLDDAVSTAAVWSGARVDVDVRETVPLSATRVSGILAETTVPRLIQAYDFGGLVKERPGAMAVLPSPDPGAALVGLVGRGGGAIVVDHDESDGTAISKRWTWGALDLDSRRWLPLVETGVAVVLSNGASPGTADVHVVHRDVPEPWAAPLRDYWSACLTGMPTVRYD